MPLSPSDLAGLIQSNLAAVGAKGSNLQKFCTAVATGIVVSVVGKPFTTMDVGFISGAGIGAGLGITGLSSSSMKSVALAAMASQGTNADKMMQAIMDGVVTHLSSKATLTSTHTPVYLGTGTINTGSILVVSVEMTTNIDAQLMAMGAIGSNRTKLSNAIASGVCSNILSSGSGTVVITGPAPPTPVPGTGVGVGVIS